jgi:hypothetical protein
MTNKTTAERVRALRDRRAELGLQRLDLYVHPDDREPVQKYARRLQRRREKASLLAP